MDEKLFYMIGRMTGIAIGMAAVAGIACGVLFGITHEQAKEIRAIKAKLVAGEEA
jgi:hypothetical protein